MNRRTFFSTVLGGLFVTLAPRNNWNVSAISKDLRSMFALNTREELIAANPPHWVIKSILKEWYPNIPPCHNLEFAGEMAGMYEAFPEMRVSILTYDPHLESKILYYRAIA